MNETIDLDAFKESLRTVFLASECKTLYCPTGREIPVRPVTPSLLIQCDLYQGVLLRAALQWISDQWEVKASERRKSPPTTETLDKPERKPYGERLERCANSVLIGVGFDDLDPRDQWAVEEYLKGSLDRYRAEDFTKFVTDELPDLVRDTSSLPTQLLPELAGTVCGYDLDRAGAALRSHFASERAARRAEDLYGLKIWIAKSVGAKIQNHRLPEALLKGKMDSELEH